MNYTPGPWHLSEDDMFSIADSENTPVAVATTQADAVLIASAPKLLETCRHILLALESEQTGSDDLIWMMAILRVAINEAEGR